MEEYGIIVTGATDCNRGDQALNWQAKKVLKDSFGIEKVYVLKFGNENLSQSEQQGLVLVDPILRHPSDHIKHKKSNIKYSILLKVIWGFFAVFDWAKSKLLLSKLFSPIGYFLLSKKQKETHQIIKGASVAVVKGGGFLHSYGKLTDAYTIYYMLYHMKLAERLGKKVVVLPNSYGPFKGPTVKRQINNVLSKCVYLSTRESISQETLKEMGLKSLQHFDMAFTLESIKTAATHAAKEKLNIQDGKIVGITVRPYRFPDSNNPEAAYLGYKNSIKQFVIWLQNNHFRPVFVEHTFSDNAHENDRVCIDEIEDLLPERIDVLSDRNMNCMELKHMYSNFYCVVGTRFHSVIFALSENVPCLAISYSGNKAPGIMSDLGLNEYCLSANDLRGDNLIEKFKLLVYNEAAYKEKLSELKCSVDSDYKLLCQELSLLMAGK